MTGSIVHNRNDRRCRLKKLLIGLLVAAAVFAVLSLALTALVLHFVFGRSELDPVNLEQSYADLDPRQYPRTPAEFYSGSSRLQAYYYETGEPLGIIVMVHGLYGGAGSHLAEVRWFVDHGWTVLCFDGTGTRESGGSGIRGLSQMKLDLLAAIRFVSGDRPGLPILLYGHSMGAYAAAAVLDDCPEVRGAVCVSGFDAPVDTMYYHAWLRVGPLAAVEYPFLYLYNYLLFGSECNESGAKAIAAGETPVLLVYGSHDRAVPEPVSLFARCEELGVSRVSFLLVEEEARNEHSTAWLTADSAEYRLSKAEELDALRRAYGGDLPRDVAEEFLRELDRGRLFILDPDFMDRVQAFYLEAVA